MGAFSGAYEGARNLGFYEGVTEQLIRYAEGFVKYDISHGTFEAKKGSGEYLTLREAMMRGGQSSRIPDYAPDPEFDYLVGEYWELKCGDIDYRIHKNDLRDTLLDRNERGIIIKMDRALLAALAKERVAASKKKAT